MDKTPAKDNINTHNNNLSIESNTSSLHPVLQTR